MNDILLGLVPAAIGLGFSPIPLIELILVVFSKRARVNGIVFLVGLAVPIFAVSVLGGTAVKMVTPDSGGVDGGAWLRLVFGVILLLVAVMNLRRYNETDTPKILESIENMGPGAVAMLALGTTLFNPKNLALLIAAGETMREGSLSNSMVVLVSAIFTLVAVLPYTVVVGYQRFGGAAAAARLETLRGMLLRNNHKIMFWMCGILGLLFLVRSVPALLG